MPARGRAARNRRGPIGVRAEGPTAIAVGHPTISRFARLPSIGLAPDRRVLEGDRDLLVAPGQLAGDHDAVAPAGVTDAVAVAELALAGDDRAGGPRPAGWRAAACRTGGRRSSSQARTGRPKRARTARRRERLALRREVARRPERLARRRRTRPAAPLPERGATALRGPGCPKRLVRRAPKTRSRSQVALVGRAPSCGPTISSAGISSRNRDGTEAWPIPHVARRQACDRYSRRLARVIPTYASRRSSSSSFSSSSARLCGKRPSSRPGDEDDRELEALGRVERDQRDRVGVALVGVLVGDEGGLLEQPVEGVVGRQVVVAGGHRAQLEQVGPALLAVLGAVREHRPVARRLQDLVEQLGQGQHPDPCPQPPHQGGELGERAARPRRQALELALRRRLDRAPGRPVLRGPPPPAAPRSSCRRCPRPGR